MFRGLHLFARRLHAGSRRAFLPHDLDTKSPAAVKNFVASSCNPQHRRFGHPPRESSAPYHLQDVSDQIFALHHVQTRMVRDLAEGITSARTHAYGPATHDSGLLPFRLTLRRPCAPGRDLLSCPDFQASQPRGPAPLPRDICNNAALRRHRCPLCDKDGKYDMRYCRMMVVRKRGVRIGSGPAKTDPGVDIACCTIM